jgi:hypothetical protein
MAVDIDDRAGIAPLAAPDAVLLIDPSHLAAAQPIRRVYVGDLCGHRGRPPGAVGGGARHRRRSPGWISPAVRFRLLSSKTCDEPMFARFRRGLEPAPVGCRRAARSPHDASTRRG